MAVSNEMTPVIFVNKWLVYIAELGYGSLLT